VLNNLGGISPKQAEEMSQRWRPWRSYAVLHIWRNPLGESFSKLVKSK
jgi:AraC family transcriptional regulator of adaptative response / DNA-3-methyladenine glycosylase II